MTLEFFVRGGEVQCVHSDAAVAFLEAAGLTGGGLEIRRASRVEVAAGPPAWQADLRPAGGPVLGPFPPDERAAAVRAEVAWLLAHLREQGPVHVHDDGDDHDPA